MTYTSNPSESLKRPPVKSSTNKKSKWSNVNLTNGSSKLNRFKHNKRRKKSITKSRVMVIKTVGAVARSLVEEGEEDSNARPRRKG
jgi:hypothetical protein